MKTTSYFDRGVMRRRPYLKPEWIEFTLKNPIRKQIQDNGRIRYWAFIQDANNFLRVVTESDGETIHNAFFDRRFKL